MDHGEGMWCICQALPTCSTPKVTLPLRCEALSRRWSHTQSTNFNAIHNGLSPILYCQLRLRAVSTTRMQNQVRALAHLWRPAVRLEEEDALPWSGVVFY